DSSNRLSQTVNNDSAADHQGAALDEIVTQNTGYSALTGKKLVPYESTAPVSSITDPAGDSLFKPLGGTYVPGADVLGVKVEKVGANMAFTIKTKGSLFSAARAAGVPTAQLTIRWQVGDTLYFAAVQENVAGVDSFFGGKTDSVDLCSVSGCKPNYLTYNAAPYPGVVSGSGSHDGDYRINIPLSALGNPTSKTVLEEMMAFVTVNPSGGGVLPQDNVTNYFDEAPLQIEGTRTFNARFGASAVSGPGAPLMPGTQPVPPTKPSGSGGQGLAATGLGLGLPVLAAALLAFSLVVLRRRRT
ncbi:MAG: hypothetical protein JWO12_2376, partial [Frankiales bacterium]|nr:hypothetical protein [Frankiales bacterium]